jgi:hypothetical protein
MQSTQDLALSQKIKVIFDNNISIAILIDSLNKLKNDEELNVPEPKVLDAILEIHFIIQDDQNINHDFYIAKITNLYNQFIDQKTKRMNVLENLRLIMDDLVISEINFEDTMKIIESFFQNNSSLTTKTTANQTQLEIVNKLLKVKSELILKSKNKGISLKDFIELVTKQYKKSRERCTETVPLTDAAQAFIQDTNIFRQVESTNTQQELMCQAEDVALTQELTQHFLGDFILFMAKKIAGPSAIESVLRSNILLFAIATNIAIGFDDKGKIQEAPAVNINIELEKNALDKFNASIISDTTLQLFIKEYAVVLSHITQEHIKKHYQYDIFRTLAQFKQQVEEMTLQVNNQTIALSQEPIIPTLDNLDTTECTKRIAENIQKIDTVIAKLTLLKTSKTTLAVCLQTIQKIEKALKAGEIEKQIKNLTYERFRLDVRNVYNFYVTCKSEYIKQIETLLSQDTLNKLLNKLDSNLHKFTTICSEESLKDLVEFKYPSGLDVDTLMQIIKTEYAKASNQGQGSSWAQSVYNLPQQEESKHGKQI